MEVRLLLFHGVVSVQLVCDMIVVCVDRNEDFFAGACLQFKGTCLLACNEEVATKKCSGSRKV